VINHKGIVVDPTKVGARLKWEKPCTVGRRSTMFSWPKLLQKVHRRILKDNDAHDAVDMEMKYI